jgi:hypothetical protein
LLSYAMLDKDNTSPLYLANQALDEMTLGQVAQKYITTFAAKKEIKGDEK